MAVVVVGGHSRNVGKTSVVAGLVASMPEMLWTAIKISQHDHDGDHGGGTPSVSVEHDPLSGTDSSRYLAAGAVRSLWVRVRRGSLAEAMPCLREEMAQAENVILESNSAMQFLQPDLYLAVLDPGTADFKDSARLYLDRADAVLMHAGDFDSRWTGVSMTRIVGKPQFPITPPDFVTAEVVEFVRGRLMQLSANR